MSLVAIRVLLLALCIPAFGKPHERPNDTGSPDEECISNADCTGDYVCVNLRCEDPCLGACGFNTACIFVNTTPLCTCKPGFTGHPFAGCHPGRNVECSTDDECPEEEACKNQKCVDACENICGSNSICKAIKHRPVCSCSPGNIWAPFSGCVSQKPHNCTIDSECPSDRACKDNACVDPCQSVCGNNTVCNVNNHLSACACKTGFTGNPLQECIAQETYECTSDIECPSNRACKENVCVDPCDNVCGSNALCDVTNHLAACACKPGFKGNPLQECTAQNPNDCSTDSECPSNRQCKNNACVDPCENVCGSNTLCEVTNHQAACACKPGFTGNPLQGCMNHDPNYCTTDTECPSNRACKANGCVNPCDNVCGTNTVCEVSSHLAACVCKPGFTGNPLQGCTTQNIVPGGSGVDNGNTLLKKKFIMSDDKLNWHAAMEKCNSKNLRLASITNALEQTEIQKVIASSGLSGYMWVSGSDWSNSGDFVWAATGKRFTYTNWGEGEPEVSTEYHCVDLREGDYTWKTGVCHIKFYYICEYYY